jgi:hypothetical protein
LKSIIADNRSVGGEEPIMGQAKSFSVCGTFMLCACLLFPGCIVESVQPLVDKEHIIYDNALLGTWTSMNCIRSHGYTSDGYGICKDNEMGENFCTLEITEKHYLSAHDGYLIILTDECGYKKEIEGKLIDLGGQRFLDTTAGSDIAAAPVGILPLPHMIPTHNFWKMTVGQDNISIGPLAYEWAEKEALSMGTLSEPNKGFFFLTAPPSQLQDLLRKNANNPKAFTDEFLTVWNRVQNAIKESKRDELESLLRRNGNVKIIKQILDKKVEPKEWEKPEPVEGKK